MMSRTVVSRGKRKDIRRAASYLLNARTIAKWNHVPPPSSPHFPQLSCHKGSQEQSLTSYNFLWEDIFIPGYRKTPGPLSGYINPWMGICQFCDKCLKSIRPWFCTTGLYCQYTYLPLETFSHWMEYIHPCFRVQPRGGEVRYSHSGKVGCFSMINSGSSRRIQLETNLQTKYWQPNTIYMYPLARGYFSFFCSSLLLEKQKFQHLDVLFRTMLGHTFSIYAIYFALLSLGPSAFTTVQIQRVNQGVTKRCRLSWLTNSSLAYEPKWGGRAGCTWSPNNFGDITPYLTYTLQCRVNKQIVNIFQ